jgi:hypothetical protein
MRVNRRQPRGAVSKSGLAAAIFSVVTGTAFATTYSGTVVDVRVNASSTGGTRVSLLTTAATACTGAANWYVFEYSGSNGPGSAWLAEALAAKISAQPVVIYGTGSCDPSGVEVVGTIDLTP